jgi:hypothetical protein
MGEQYNLNLIFLPDGGQPFALSIQSTQSVAQVAALVREREPAIAGRFGASQLRLYQVDVPDVDKAIEKMEQMNLDQDKLNSLKKLNKVYTSCPADNIIHFVVLLPSRGESVKPIHRLHLLVV